MAHVAKYKKRIVNDLVKLFKSYPIIGCLDMENLPAPQLQQMKAQLRDKVVMTMTKRRLMKIAIEQCKVKSIEKIKEHLLGMPALLFTKEDPFKLSKILQKSKSLAHAKSGQIAPSDIIINAGPTPFSPGPIIGELSKLGLKTGVEANKIVIKEDKIMVKKGEIINQEAASILARLDIKPMEIGLNLVAILENGEIIPKEVLIINEEEYLAKLQRAHNYAFNLSIEAGIIIKDNIDYLLSKAFNQAKILALEGNIISDVVVKEMLSKAEKQALNIKEEGKIETDIKKEKDYVHITYFVHGTTIDNEKGLATGWAPGELSELGKKQSIELREKIKNKKFDIVFCSDLKRAVDSANLTFENIQIIQDKRLREVNYGDFTQKPSKEFKSNMIKYVEKPFPNGESYEDVEKRIIDFLNELFDKYKKKHVAIVAHQAPQLALDVLLKGKTWEQAINEDWRKKEEWKPGWDYELKNKIIIKEKKIKKTSEKAQKPIQPPSETKEVIKEVSEEDKKIDKKVSKMVEKAKDFSKGKKTTTDDILKEGK